VNVIKSTFFLILLSIILIYPNTSYGQELSIGISKFIPVSEQVEDGDIISINDNLYTKSIKEYDIGTIGVVTLNPAIEINDTSYNGNEGRYPVLSSGNALVKVVKYNGDIKKGDLLTTSNIPGVAMKSLRPGFVVGIAEEDFPSNVGNDEVHKIKATIHLHYSYSGDEEGSPDKLAFTDIFAITKLLEYQSPSAILKYLFAAFVIIVSIIFGYFTFARIASRGIEAVGRNPLASKAINVSIVVNVAITITIVIAGLALGYLIIVL
jgi:F0F1-type ATP synthase membrane subunit c/vacuolar-type H+-ATPase subunit K